MTPTRAARLFGLLLASPILASLPGCTDLTESPASSITAESYYRNEAEVLGGLAAVYAQLRYIVRDDGDYWNITEVSSDEMIVPTRGQDWYDNGRWLEIDRQLWEPTSPSGLADINRTWTTAFAGIARANLLLERMADVTMPNKPVVEAETKALRAFFYYILMDMFGGVPIVEESQIATRPRNTRAEVFDFIEDELTAARAALPVLWTNATEQGRMTKGAADAILASMYLNAQVFTGTVTTAGLQPGAARWQDAIDAADRIINSPAYSLATGPLGSANDWRSLFKATNDGSTELIFVVKHRAQDGLGMNFLMRSLHYTQLTPAPWNGFATIADVYNAFDADDQRRQIFLVGPQVNLETGEPVNDRTGQTLIFTPEIADPTQATEGEGVRIAKWPVDPAHVGPEHGNDYAFFRLGEIYLIKAEALNELGQSGAAITLVNQIRARVFEPDEPLTPAGSIAGVRDQILQERLFELTGEAKRRQDLIRHGKFTMAWLFKAAREGYRILLPIPQTQIDANPELEQNPGY